MPPHTRLVTTLENGWVMRRVMFYCELLQVVTQSAIFPDVASLLKKINTVSGTLTSTSGLENVLYII